VNEPHINLASNESYWQGNVLQNNSVGEEFSVVGTATDIMQYDTIQNCENGKQMLFRMEVKDLECDKEIQPSMSNFLTLTNTLHLLHCLVTVPEERKASSETYIYVQSPFKIRKQPKVKLKIDPTMNDWRATFNIYFFSHTLIY
jgi:hypothetical protein